uniref:Transcription factor bHLH3-delta n=1 Tax=Fragaria ananassa TaxID=3747 RepID=I3WCS6_FRAAN|nr:transcription factor bHLH3-delta [Fragaria x ananassa]
MATPPPSSSRLRGMLQSAVQSVQWTYSLFWQICPQQGMLIWADGYYNGAIKTRKTVQPMEVSSEEASLQRSQQLRELYDTLSAGETNQPARRPCAALSPEDLTESEWFYLMCVSFSFPPGVGLPGKAYSRRQHVWLTGANEVDSKTFSRAILAKSARVQTVVCIPLLDGVVELGTTDRVPEDLAFVQHVKTFFVDHHHLPPPKPALSEHSTSNPATSSDHHPRFHSPHLTAIRNNAAANNPPPLHPAAKKTTRTRTRKKTTKESPTPKPKPAVTVTDVLSLLREQTSPQPSLASSCSSKCRKTSASAPLTTPPTTWTRTSTCWPSASPPTPLISSAKPTRIAPSPPGAGLPSNNL